jgi:hypothetical protein
MDSVHYPPRRRIRRRRTAGPLRLRVRWLLVRLYGPVDRMRRSRHIYQGRRAVDREQAWRGNRALMRASRVAVVVGAVVFILWLLRALMVVITGNPSAVWPDFDTACDKASLSCDTLNAFPGLFLPLGLAFMLFLNRLQRVQRPYVRKAREKPQDVVLTAGSMIGEVVGRDELCHVMIADLRDPQTRRPQVVTGIVGTGKTALLVRLTKLLARAGAIPVPVRLRDAQDELDFRALARRRFLADTDVTLTDDAEGERIWRHLCQQDRVVVLADGLEEALIEGEAEKERDTLIRLAVRRANDDGLPLIIASRPHDALRGVEAAFVELEPLSEETALDYIKRGGARDDERRLDWIVQTAEVAESPLYLQITRQLQQVQLLEYVSASRDGELLAVHGADRAALRLRLLEVWTRALIDGHFPSGLLLSHADRQAIIEQLSALACIGLKQDRLYVSFDDLDRAQARPRSSAPSTEAGTARAAAWVRGLFRLPPSGHDWVARPHPAINREVERRLEALGRRLDLRLAAVWGTQLGLVEARRDGVLFPHSIVQAFLGSRLIHVAMADARYRSEALKDPGRELLVALVLHSRAEARDGRLNEAIRPRVAGRGGNRRQHRDLLRMAARHRRDVKALDLYAAALEIDSLDEALAHQAIAGELHERWPDIWARDQRTLEEAKLQLVRRFGEAARKIAKEHRGDQAYPTKPAYVELYRIGCSEPSYPIRLAVAQEIGSGGEEAFDALQNNLGPPGSQVAAPGMGRWYRRSAPRPRVVAGHVEEDTNEEERSWREGIMRAWLAPLLVGSVSTRRARDARERLEQWLALVGRDGDGRAQDRLGLSFEVALAQGFKYAANRRREHPHARPETRPYLAEKAREMLRSTNFWFSRLTLVHALCLWSLPDGVSGRPFGRGRDGDPRAVVEHWDPLREGWMEHPLVVEARRLAVLALETGQPERFIWIDESGIIARVGSRARPVLRRKHYLWIPPSTGWAALHTRAQWLVADVLLLLNLAERGRRPSDRERRLKRTDRSELPPCLAGDRSPLDPMRTLGMAATSEPGSNCKPGCPFELCPYPLESEQSFRVELSDAFCRRQLALVSSRSLGRRTAPWQEALPGDLRRFWRQMGARARAQRQTL